ncbi:unnamed protein product [Cylicocyclus nassatus]|uniref:Secreted protein n=1 Tax=Cylicocyclus nassatus TaxID=53992 RepID=A0AA36HDC1_CYLNA|nr:unnamed protein product [Cylicocyclus nassatus]
MVNFRTFILSAVISVWVRQTRSMDCSEICGMPELIYHCCQCIGCHHGLSPNAIAPAIAGLRFGKRSPYKADSPSVSTPEFASKYRTILPRRWIFSSVLY